MLAGAAAAAVIMARSRPAPPAVKVIPARRRKVRRGRPAVRNTR